MNGKLKNNQSGMVSIMITMIMILVISLIVLGFAQVTRRNQREALDRQLSTQAYYAAESGINAAAKFFANNPGAQIDTITNGDCNTFINGASYLNGASTVLSSANNVSYTCLSVNSQPVSLQVAPLTQESNTVWHLQSSSGSFGTLKFTWNSDPAYTGANNCSSYGTSNLPPYGSWSCPYGILRVDLVSVAAVSNAALEANTNTHTIYMFPGGAPTSADLLSPNKALVAHATCGTSCSATVTGVNGTEYYARLTMMYKDSSSASVADGTAALGVKFVNGQAIVDATGQATDELRRVQVRIPLVKSVSTLPNFGLQSTDSICKVLSVAPNIYSSDCL
jgi:Tfp pilus assembly protein PilX